MSYLYLQITVLHDVTTVSSTVFITARHWNLSSASYNQSDPTDARYIFIGPIVTLLLYSSSYLFLSSFLSYVTFLVYLKLLSVNR